MTRSAKRALFVVLAIVSFIAFCVLCGEETPDRPVSELSYYGTKSVAAVVLYFGILGANHFYESSRYPKRRIEPDKEEN
ncbi:MAG: hypothetical protein HDS59_00135 [Barnesiella sp.]|nr:hypothetical protein [Barnesiella sp.]